MLKDILNNSVELFLIILKHSLKFSNNHRWNCSIVAPFVNSSLYKMFHWNFFKPLLFFQGICLVNEKIYQQISFLNLTGSLESA